MYKPQDLDRPQYPMFRKVNGRIISFLSARGAAAIGAATALAVLLALLLGLPGIDVEVEATEADRLEARALLQAERAACALPSAEEELAALCDASGRNPRPGLTDQERERFDALTQEVSRCRAVLGAYSAKTDSELVALAGESGVGRSTTDAQIDSMLPAVKTVTEPIVPGPVRWAAALTIIGLAFVLFSEFDGRSLASKLLLSRRFSGAQHIYRYRRLTGSRYEGKVSIR